MIEIIIYLYFSLVEDYNLLKLKTEIRMGKGSMEPSFLCKELREKNPFSVPVFGK